MARLFATVVVVAALAAPATAGAARVGHVTDGDTIVLADGTRVRLVQIDAPEVYSGVAVRGKARKPQRAYRRYTGNGEVPQQLRLAVEKVLKAART